MARSPRPRSSVLIPVAAGFALLALVLALVPIGTWRSARSSSAAVPASSHSAAMRRAAAATKVAAPARAAPYPRGRWRLAVPSELDHVVLWFSHVLVQYEAADIRRVPFSADLWYQPEHPIGRSRDAALAQATALQLQLARGEAEFEQLARRSDDVVRRSVAGSVGAIRAADLRLWPQVLDALAVLSPEEPSLVVETEFGFHIIKRHPPPPEEKLSGQRLVVGHSDARWLDFARGEGRDFRNRPRNEALELAKGYRRRAAELPASFLDLVAKNSDHVDAKSDGNTGVWSSREANALNPEIQALATLREGELSEPVDTPLGFQVIRRVAPELPLRPVAMSMIQLAFDGRAKREQPHSRDEVKLLVQSIAAALARDPSQFEVFQGRYCCTGAQHWYQGRGVPPLGPAVEALALGAMSTTPLEDNDTFVILRRDDPQKSPGPEIRFELPAPTAPNLDWLVAHSAVEGVSAFVQQIAPEVAKDLALEQKQTAALIGLHQKFAKSLENAAGPTERVAALHATFVDTEAQLGNALFQRYMAWLSGRVGKLFGIDSGRAAELVGGP
jgi:hypothetical protein